MVIIPRTSVLNLSDEEKNVLRAINEKEKRKNEKRLKKESRTGEVSDQEVSNELIANLYYDIGMQDFWVYRDATSETLSKEAALGYFAKRAIDSARLQVLLEDMERSGLDTGMALSYAEGSKEITEPIIIYHGTSEPLETQQIGEPNENGAYAIRDGVSYWTTDYEEAESYSRHLTPDQRDRGITEGQGKVHSKTILPGADCRVIPATHGGACFMWQDEFVRMNQEGVQYLFSRNTNEPDIFDIRHFADFVQKRDACVIDEMEQYDLHLPEQSDTLFRLF